MSVYCNLAEEILIYEKWAEPHKRQRRLRETIIDELIKTDKFKTELNKRTRANPILNPFGWHKYV